MSRDIFVQDIPADVREVSDIADDFRPQSIGSRDQIIAVISQIAPDADFSDPAWGTVDRDGYSIEVNLGEEARLTSFAFHVRDATGEADQLVAEILSTLDLRAFDSASDSGIFEAP